ncbi:hypothetical protein [Trichloromonas sp.]|uniref:hypothetical protein n=1 Tax=Trichloromonas sp. TaxID=3069249 RepID=UPI002A37905D|nr:hypothetical protein [Trichloromonas sp.]
MINEIIIFKVNIDDYYDRQLIEQQMLKYPFIESMGVSRIDAKMLIKIKTDILTERKNKLNKLLNKPSDIDIFLEKYKNKIQYVDLFKNINKNDLN